MHLSWDNSRKLWDVLSFFTLTAPPERCLWEIKGQVVKLTLFLEELWFLPTSLLNEKTINWKLQNLKLWNTECMMKCNNSETTHAQIAVWPGYPISSSRCNCCDLRDVAAESVRSGGRIQTCVHKCLNAFFVVNIVAAIQEVNLMYFVIDSIFEEKWQKAQLLLYFTLNIHSISPFLHAKCEEKCGIM